MVTTAALTGFAATASAHDFSDPRLELVHRALRPRLALLGSPGGGAPAPQDQTFPFDIPGGPIRDVVAAFERVTGATVTISLDSINPIFSPGVKGTFTFEQGLRMLLEDDRHHVPPHVGADGGADAPLAERVGQRRGPRRRRRVAEVFGAAPRHPADD